MREIKFRAWHKNGETMMPDVKNVHTLNSEFQNDNLIFMQFTGLKDIDAIEVFDADCIEYEGFISRVFWSDSDFGFVFYNEILNEHTGLSFFIGYKKFKVVGNIYSNPELLEQKDE